MPRKATSTLTLADQRLLTDVLKHWQRRLAESPQALKACQARKFTAGDVERRRIGYADGSLPATATTAQHEALRRLGLLDKRDREVLRGCLTIPTLAPGGQVESIEGVPVNGNGKGKVLTIRLQAPAPTCATELDEDGVLTVSRPGAVYVLKGLKWDGVDCRCLLKVSDGKVSHVDKLDLALARARSTFAKAFEAAGGPPAEATSRELLQVLAEMDRAAPLIPAERASQTPELSAEDEAEAVAFLQQRDLLTRVVEDLTAVGYVGENETKALAYLVAISRKLPACLSLILQSSSGAGKSYLLECVARLCPPEDVLYFSRISPQSLYYMKAGALRNRLVIVDERGGSEEADYSIRTLQTRRKLTLAIPIKDAASGRTETKVFEVEGPIAFMESTTQAVHPENASRAFVVSLEETREQTKAIIGQQRKQAASLPVDERADLKALVRRHHNAQRLLKHLPVVVPFAQSLRFAAHGNALRARREHQRYVTFIQASALLHQRQRKIATEGGIEYVEASRDDEKVATRLLAEIQRRGHAELPDHAAALLRWLQKQSSPSEFTRRQMSAALGWTYYKVRLAVAELHRQEYLVRLGSGAGQTFRYRLAAT